MCPRVFFGKRDMFIKLYEKGQERIESELDIVKIIRSIRNMKVLLKNSFMDEEIKYKILHSKKNLINIDETLSSCDEEQTDAEENSQQPDEMDPKNIRRKLTGAISSNGKRKTPRKKPLNMHFDMDEKTKLGNLIDKN